MTVVRKVKIVVEQEGNAKAGLSGIAGSLGKIGEAAKGGLSGIAGSLGKIGEAARVAARGMEPVVGAVKLAAGGIGLLGGAALTAGSFLIGLGSDAEEMEGKFNTVFGDSAPSAAKELDEFGNAVGRNKYELMGFAATLQDTFVPLGFARDEAAKMSTELTTLAVDLGSFNNIAEADVMADLQTAVVGNTEVMRKYGVVINEAAIKQEAVNSGLVKTEVNQDKVETATNKLAIAQQKLAELQQGGGASATQLMTATEGVRNAEEKLEIAKQKLLEVQGKENASASQVMSAQNAVEAATVKVAIAQEKLVETQNKGGPAASQLMAAQEAVRKAEEDLAEATTGTTGELDAQAKAQAILNLIMKGTSDAQGDAERTSGGWANQMRALKAELSEAATSMGKELLPVVIPLLKEFIVWVREVMPQAVVIFKNWSVELKATVGPAMLMIQDALTRIAQAFGVQTDKVTVSQAVLKAFKAGLDALVIALKLAAVAMQGVAWATERVSEAIRIAKGLSDQLGTIVKLSMDKIKGALNTVIGKWNDFKQAVKSAVNAIPTWLLPGSPTPFEIGLKGIAKATGQVANTLPQAFAVSGGGPPLAGAGGGAGGGAIIVNLTYAPVVSTASQLEAERVLAPFIAAGVRQQLGMRAG